MYRPCRPTATVPSVKAANKTTASSPVLMEGYLMKQKHGKCKAWLRRYFILYKDELRYVKTKRDTNTLAVISLAHYSLELDAQPLTSLNQKQWKNHTFGLISDDEQKFDWPDYYLQASNANERQLWVDTLQANMRQSYSVLDKWLERLQLPPVARSSKASLASISGSSLALADSYKPLISSSSSIPTPHSTLHPPLNAKSASFCHDRGIIPPLSETYSDKSLNNEQRLVRLYRSTETLNTYTTQTTTDANTIASSAFSKFRGRPSDYALAKSRSTDLSSNTRLTSKLFLWSHPRNRTPYKSYSSSTSMESSFTDPVPVLDHTHQFSASCHVIAEAVETPITCQAVAIDTDCSSFNVKQPSVAATTRYYYNDHLYTK